VTMEWVEVRGETLEAAKEEALDQLGVAHDDAEFEVVQESESRWMGFKKTEARVRARVRPTQPRPKAENRNNRRKGRGDKPRDGGNTRGAAKGGGTTNRGRAEGGGNRPKGGGNNRGPKGENGSGRQSEGARNKQSEKSGADSRGPANERPQRDAEREGTVSEETRQEAMPVDQQQSAAEAFLSGLAEGFALDGSVSSHLEDDVIITAIDGDDLGLMIGPKGGTMYAIQELTRSAVQRQSDGRDTGRLMVDVAGYREKRRGALAEFAGLQAAKVVDDGLEIALEPMNSADRKAVHDAIVETDGVRSISEGEDPRRRVVLLPDND
jgi:spoIIIJ-associated protein